MLTGVKICSAGSLFDKWQISILSCLQMLEEVGKRMKQVNKGGRTAFIHKQSTGCDAVNQFLLFAQHGCCRRAVSAAQHLHPPCNQQLLQAQIHLLETAQPWLPCMHRQWGSPRTRSCKKETSTKNKMQKTNHIKHCL